MKAEIAVFFLCRACWFAGLTFGVVLTKFNYQNEAIDLGYAEHRPETGAWQWKKAVHVDGHSTIAIQPDH